MQQGKTPRRQREGGKWEKRVREREIERKSQRGVFLGKENREGNGHVVIRNTGNFNEKLWYDLRERKRDRECHSLVARRPKFEESFSSSLTCTEFNIIDNFIKIALIYKHLEKN